MFSVVVLEGVGAGWCGSLVRVFVFNKVRLLQ